MVIADTIDLAESDIRAAQKTTLRTLFDHVAANGQIPPMFPSTMPRPITRGWAGSAPWTAACGPSSRSISIHERTRTTPCSPNMQSSFSGWPKEHLNRHIPEWVDNARRFIREHGLSYECAADVFVLSSRYEPFGMTAMGCARRVGLLQ